MTFRRFINPIEIIEWKILLNLTGRGFTVRLTTLYGKMVEKKWKSQNRKAVSYGLLWESKRISKKASRKNEF